MLKKEKRRLRVLFCFHPFLFASLFHPDGFILLPKGWCAKLTFFFFWWFSCSKERKCVYPLWAKAPFRLWLRALPKVIRVRRVKGRARLKEKKKKNLILVCTLCCLNKFCFHGNPVRGGNNKTFAFYLVFRAVCNQKRKKNFQSLQQNQTFASKESVAYHKMQHSREIQHSEYSKIKEVWCKRIR